jgi:hypothetical protein
VAKIGTIFGDTMFETLLFGIPLIVIFVAIKIIVNIINFFKE